MKKIINDEDLFMDIPAHDRYLKSHIKSIEIKERLETYPYFQGKQNHDFYLGMIAGFRASLSFHFRNSSKQEFEEAVTDSSIMATILAIEKKNL